MSNSKLRSGDADRSILIYSNLNMTYYITNYKRKRVTILLHKLIL